METLKKDKSANSIALDSYPVDDLHLLAYKKHLRFVMKDGKLAACHADYDLPPQVFAMKYLRLNNRCPLMLILAVLRASSQQ